jgi:hypothetical protein
MQTKPYGPLHCISDDALAVMAVCGLFATAAVLLLRVVLFCYVATAGSGATAGMPQGQQHGKRDHD